MAGLAAILDGAKLGAGGEEVPGPFTHIHAVNTFFSLRGTDDWLARVGCSTTWPA